MVGWDVVSNIPDGVAPNGKQLWQAKWEENLEKTHRYSQSKGLKACHFSIAAPVTAKQCMHTCSVHSERA